MGVNVFALFIDESPYFGDKLGRLMLMIILFSSISWIRRRHFEWFFYLHFTFIAFFAFGSLHSTQFLHYMIAAMVFYVLDRLFRLILGLWPVKANLRIKGLEFNDREYQIVQLTFPKNPTRVTLKSYKIAQYVFVNFPSIGMASIFDFFWTR